ncbi:MAG: transposase [Desulfitobacteriaceae bacterium]|nr:transposase [Desulfitobacteriaceae bacterium]
MVIGSNFEYITNLQYKVKSLTRQVQSFESGQKYLLMRSEFTSRLAARGREINKLKAELARAHSETVTMRENWWQVFEDICNEHKKELEKKDRMIKNLETQLLLVQQQLDAAKDKLRDKNIELYQAKTEIEDLKGVILQLKAQINRDYENSSIPSSQKPNHKKITNNREKTGRKPGGQEGHDGHPRKKHTPTEYIHIPAPNKYIDSDDYKPTGKIVRKQVINISVTVNVVEYDTPEFRNVRTGQRVHADFPEGVVNDVNYGGSVKAAAFLLNNRYGVSIDKVQEFLSDITDGELQISKGMINGLCKEFSARTKEDQKKAFSDMLLSPVINADFTNARVNGKSAQVAICCVPGTTLYFAREHKGHKGISGTPVECYHGILVHDHDIVFYSYGDNHQECLIHVLRYLKDSMENEPNRQWNQRMRGLLQEMIHYRKGLPDENPEPDPDKVQEFENRYIEILELAKKEYDYEPPNDYYKDGYNLYKRLDGYRDSHLLFLHDIRVPTNNNLCERKGRVFKRKQRQVMAFRSFDSLVYLCNSMSMVDLLSAKKDNLFRSIAAILN